MAFSFKRFFEGIRIIPKTSSTVDSAGELDFSTSTNKLNLHNGTTSSPIVTEAHTATLTNKTFDANGTGNSIANIEVADFASGVLDTDLTSVSASDNTIPSAKAVKAYVDAIDLTHDAASEIAFTPAGTIAASNVQTAVEEVATDAATALSAHTGSSTAHAATAITNSPTGNLAATTVQGALNELQTDVDTRATSAALTSHTGASSGAHAASAISNTASGNLAATDVQGALNELQTDVDTRATTATVLLKANNLSDLASASTARTNLSLGNVDNTSDATKNSAVATLSNKTLSDALKFTEISSPSTPGAGLRYFYPKTDGKFYHLGSDGVETAVGSGSGGGINHISTNPDAETATTGWVTYADAAGTSPVDGTGGSPSITWTRSTSSPLRSSGSFLLTKGASNRQGDGVAFAFAPARADRYTQHTVKFTYEVASGTYADGDLRVYLYDVTNSTVIEPVGVQLLNIGVNGVHQATFQTSDSVSYRLCVHVASTSASAYTVKFDDVEVYPTQSRGLARGPMISDWTSYTPLWNNNGASGAAIGNATVTGKYRRFGDSIQVGIEIIIGSTTTFGATGLTLSIPSGLTFDTSKFGITGNAVFGEANALVGGATWYTGNVIYSTSNLINIVSSGSTSFWKNTIPGSWTTGDTLALRFSAPITGWASNQVLSSEEDGRVVCFEGSVASQAVTANTTDITATTVKDSHGGWSTNIYTVKVPGDYLISASIWTSGSNTSMKLYKNGSWTNKYVSGGTIPNSGSALLTGLKAGDTISIRNDSSVTTTANGHIGIQRLSGPSQIAASESVSCRYTTASGQSVANSTFTQIIFGTKVSDSHGAMNSATGLFTAPISGRYLITAKIQYSAVTNAMNLYVYKNGSTYSMTAQAGAVVPAVTVTEVVPLLAGETMAIVTWQNSGGSKTLDAAASENSVAIDRIGSY